MKRIKFTLICTAALTLALSFAGCMHGDSGSTTKQNVEQQIETQLDEDDNCPDGKCPDNECPDGNCDKLPENRDGNGGCPDGRCPVRLLPPRGRHGGRITPLPRPHKGN